MWTDDKLNVGFLKNQFFIFMVGTLANVTAFAQAQTQSTPSHGASNNTQTVHQDVKIIFGGSDVGVPGVGGKSAGNGNPSLETTRPQKWSLDSFIDSLSPTNRAVLEKTPCNASPTLDQGQSAGKDLTGFHMVFPDDCDNVDASTRMANLQGCVEAAKLTAKQRTEDANVCVNALDLQAQSEKSARETSLKGLQEKLDKKLQENDLAKREVLTPEEGQALLLDLMKQANGTLKDTVGVKKALLGAVESLKDTYEKNQVNLAKIQRDLQKRCQSESVSVVRKFGQSRQRAATSVFGGITEERRTVIAERVMASDNVGLNYRVAAGQAPSLVRYKGLLTRLDKTCSKTAVDPNNPEAMGTMESLSVQETNLQKLFSCLKEIDNFLMANMTGTAPTCTEQLPTTNGQKIVINSIPDVLAEEAKILKKVRAYEAMRAELVDADGNLMETQAQVQALALLEEKNKVDCVQRAKNAMQVLETFAENWVNRMVKECGQYLQNKPAICETCLTK